MLLWHPRLSSFSEVITVMHKLTSESIQKCFVSLAKLLQCRAMHYIAHFLHSNSQPNGNGGCRVLQVISFATSHHTTDNDHMFVSTVLHVKALVAISQSISQRLSVQPMEARLSASCLHG